MTINRSINRSICRLFNLLLLSGAGALPVVAGEVPLRSYAATYDVAVGSQRVGVSELRLEQQGDYWQFSLVSEAQGIYALLTSEQPSTKTRFLDNADGLWLQDIRIGDARAEQAEETAQFDWAEGRLEVDRKGRHRSLELGSGVYGLLTVHLLAADLSLSDRERAQFKLYRKGKLVSSRLVSQGDQRLRIGERDVLVQVFEQTISGKSTRMRYYYEAVNPLLPLKIEKIENDEVTTMSLTDVKWDL